MISIEKEEKISKALEKFRDLSFAYRELGLKIFDKCTDILKGIRFSITWRVKSEESVKRKLDNKFDELCHIDNILNGLSDIVGVRIATYLEEDRVRVQELIVANFILAEPGNGKANPQKKDNKDNHYRAIHCDVMLNDDECVGEIKTLKGKKCEIQICSLLAHVWNEINHDLGYKPSVDESISETEKHILDMLGDVTKVGDKLIKQLIESSRDRVAASPIDKEFSDVNDFVSRMSLLFNNASDFSANAGQLFDELKRINLLTVKSIEEKFLKNGDPDKQLGKVLIDQHNRNLAENAAKYFYMDDKSSDLLLALILNDANLRKSIIKTYPAGRGQGRPKRIASLAREFDKRIGKKTNKKTF